MTPDRWKRAEDLFYEAVEVDPAERQAWVKAACGEDTELLAEVESLLECDQAAGDGFVLRQIQPAVANLLEDRAQLSGPRRVGSYRVVSELGRGGMGTVYLAERDDDEYHTQVAIKLVRAGMDTEMILHRFYRERQTLARLQHPNIARLLDGGTTADGEPYIVMEYVQGTRITDYCKQHGLNARQRLGLFLDVCKAVQYAHRNFVVHRDLKPGNILVDNAGVVKLLDFGICKLLQNSEPSATATIGLTPAYTPDYASPEQIRAEPINVTSDVYSAAAVLYELLTGVLPHRITDYTPRGIERAICEEEIVKPSVAASEQPWVKQLIGDLDNILLHALEKEPTRRYETVDQFADDIERYLSDEPVRARPSTMGYRLKKFVQRRSGLVAAAAAIALTMAAGVAVSWRSARIANENLGLVRKLSNTFVFDVYDSVKELPGSTAARQLIVKTGLEYLDNLSRNAGSDIELQKELAEAYSRIGDVQGNVMLANLGKTGEAMISYNKALNLWRAAANAQPKVSRARFEEVRLHKKMSTLMEYTKEPKKARAQILEAKRLATLLKIDFPDGVRAIALWGGLHVIEGMQLQREGDYKIARDTYSAGLAEMEKVEDKYRGDPEFDGNLVTLINGRAMCDVHLGRLREALEAFNKGVAWRERQVELNPNSGSVKRNLMFEYSHKGDLLGNPNLSNLGDRPGAVEAYRKMIDIARQLHEADPKDQRARSDYAIALSRVSAVLPDNAYDERIRTLRQSIQLQRDVESVTPDNLLNRADLVYNHNFLGDALDASGQVDLAQKTYEQGIKIAETMLPGTQSTLLATTALIHRKLGILHGKRGERDLALRHARAVLELTNPETELARKRPVDFQRFFTVRGFSAMGLAHAALARSSSRNAQDAKEARRWLSQSLARYRELSKLPTFSNTNRNEVVVLQKALEELP